MTFAKRHGGVEAAHRAPLGAYYAGLNGTVPARSALTPSVIVGGFRCKNEGSAMTDGGVSTSIDPDRDTTFPHTEKGRADSLSHARRGWRILLLF